MLYHSLKIKLQKIIETPAISLLFIFLSIFIIKIYLIMFMQTPWIQDELVYAQTARSILMHHQLIPIELMDYQLYPPGYPLVISFAYLFNDQELVYITILIINAFISTLLIPCTYFLALRYLDAKHALITSMLVGISPAVIPYIFAIMSENLFIPLFMLSILLLYSATSSMNMKNWFLVGLLTGFLVLVRIQGIAMVFALSIVLLWGLTKKTIPIKNCIITFLGTMIFLGPYLVFRLNQLSTVSGYPENYYISNLTASFSTMSGFLTFTHLIVNELGYLFICGLGILTFSGCLFIYHALRNTHLPTKIISMYFCTTAFITIIITVLHMFGPYLGHHPWYEVFGRYLDPLMPPLTLFGFIFLFSHNYFSLRIKTIFIVLSTIVLLTFPCGIYHPTATWAIFFLMYLKDLIPYQLILLLLLVLPAVFLLRPDSLLFKTICITLIFLFINLFAIHFHLRNGAVENIGLWVKKQSPPVEQVFFDKKAPYYEGNWRLTLFWNPHIKVEYCNIEPTSRENFAKSPVRRTLLLTDKSLDLPCYEDTFLGNKVYEITNKVYP